MTISLAPLTDGMHADMARDRYDAIGRVNFSTLKAMAKSAAHYHHGLTSPPHDTDAKKVGRVVHIAAFEPERFRASVAVWDGGTRRGKDWDAFKERNREKELLTLAEYERCIAIQKAVRGDATAMRYVSRGRGEVSLLWTMGRDDGANSYSIACKGRVDFDAAEALVDLKTTRDGSLEGFGREVWKYGYHVQAAWYADGYERATGVRKPYVLVAAESAEPHVVQVYRVPEKYMEAGRDTYRNWLDRLAWCRETSQWPGYADGEMELELPRWAGFDDDENLEGLDLETSGSAALED